jgi:5-methyltetrahydropteroyltriglutamate--homocysteine methyltransferase
MERFHVIHTHAVDFPRMGAQRELKLALERYWRGETDAAALETTGRELRARHWALQRDAVGAFAFCDHVAHHIQMFGCEPARFGFAGDELERYFTMARGVAAAHSHGDDHACAPHAGGSGKPALVPADRRDSRRTRRLQMRRTDRTGLPRSDAK